MSNTVKDFRNDLFNLKEELQDKQVMVRAENGLLFPAKIKFKFKEKTLYTELTNENVECVIITYD